MEFIPQKVSVHVVISQLVCLEALYFMTILFSHFLVSPLLMPRPVHTHRLVSAPASCLVSSH